MPTSYSMENEPQQACMAVTTGESSVSGHTPGCPQPHDMTDILLIKMTGHFLTSAWERRKADKGGRERKVTCPE